MKNFKLLAILFVAIGLFSSCKSDGVAEDASLATTAPTISTSADLSTPKAAQPKATPTVPVGPLTSVNFEETTFDFGEIMEGEKVEHVYKFKNTGKEPLIISNAKGSCGCTVPDWPKEPIPVGGTGEIMVRFDSKGKGKVGGNAQTKTVTVSANTDPGDTRLYIKGKVDKEEAPSS